MSYSSRAWTQLFLCSAAALTGCAPHTAAPVPEHLAVLRFENLGADVSNDWMGRAFSEVISSELSASGSNFVIASARLHAMDRSLGVRPLSTPGISSERSEAILAGANRIAYGEYIVKQGRVEARVTIEDPATSKMTAVLTSSGGDVLSAATALARQISSRAGAYDTRNPQALRHFVAALESQNAAATSQEAEQAIAADPNFAPPYRLAAESKAQQQDRDGALALIQRALARGDAISATERAQLQFQAANLRNDPLARQQALAALANSNPSDAQHWRALGETAYVRHDYKQALEAFRKALQIEPKDANLLNETGYAEAYSGDLEAALRDLRSYQAMRPADVNPLDSMGDVNLISGRLREAEDFYLQADRKDRKFAGGGDLLKAGMARLMTGDVPGASAIFKQYAEVRTAMKDPAVPIQESQWNWISGRRDEARKQLKEFATAEEDGPQRDMASAAYSQLAIWSLTTGDRAGAAQLSTKAANVASQASAGTAVIARFVSQPSAPAAEWQARADRLFPNAAQAGIKDLTLAYALLLDKQFQAANAILQRLYESGNSDPAIPIMLAWTYVEMGREQQAEPLLQYNPIPAGLPVFCDFYFPRLYDLRARVARKMGRAAEANSNADLYKKLSGAGL